MRPVGLFLAVVLLALANFAGALPSVACDPAGAQAYAASDVKHASAKVVDVQESEPAGHHHHGPHQHDQGCLDGCCGLCSAATPHVLIQGSEILADTPSVGVFFAVASAAIAQARAGLPFRPPRLA